MIIASEMLCPDKGKGRAIDGAGIRRIFSSSPRDPRYHMLSFISNKFYQEPQPHAREPRAAFFLNRFTRTSTIMFATNGVANILGLQPSQLVGKSFYYCIAPNCLDDAIRCLESAKANDSIAYLRFWFRDPTHESLRLRGESGTSSMSEDEDDDGGVSIGSGTGRSSSSVQMTSPPPLQSNISAPRVVEDLVSPDSEKAMSVDGKNQQRPNGEYYSREYQSRSSSDESNQATGTTSDSIFDPPSLPHQSSASSVTPMEEPAPIEVEAVVSCTSDGLVLVLRRARPLVPHTAGVTDTPYYANGLFASPWASDPIVPSGLESLTVAPNVTYPPSKEPVESGFMAAIRDVAVFAWSLTGINGSLVDHSHGKPLGESLPPGGLPVWDPNAQVDSIANERWNGYMSNTHRRIEDTEEGRKQLTEEILSSDDEVLYKRVPQQPPWRRPKRRGHHDAFGHEEAGEDADREDSGTRALKRGRRHVEGSK